MSFIKNKRHSLKTTSKKKKKLSCLECISVSEPI